jgi:antitoxin PrlF
METTITGKGQVTIPKHIRDSLHLAPGSKLVFDVDAEGELVLRKSKQIRAVRIVSTAPMSGTT